jgi:hypothetical protein
VAYIISILCLSNSTNFTNLLVSGASTINSSLNVVGNVIGSGTALTNLNYNAITNRPDLTVYATNTNLNNLYRAFQEKCLLYENASSVVYLFQFSMSSCVLGNALNL